MGAILVRLWDWLKGPIRARFRQHGSAFVVGFLLGSGAGAWFGAKVISLWHQKTISELRATNEKLKEQVELLRIQTSLLLDVRPITGEEPQKPTDATRAPAPGSVPIPRGDRIQVSPDDAARAAQAFREARRYRAEGYTSRALSSCLTAYKLLPPTVKQQLDAAAVRLAFTDEITDVTQLNEALDKCQRIFDNPAARRLVGGK